MLAYYRNNIVHVFLNEAYIATSIEAFGENLSEEEGIPLQRIWEQTEFLSKVLKDEFQVRNQIDGYETFLKHIKFMEKRKFISIQTSNNGKQVVKVPKDGEFAIRFLSSLILPFVESYWATVALLVIILN